jgi:glycosyltransferase involved in cell wall biosynthesis
MIKVSAVIITYNEEQNIERCLTSLADVADEVIVVDSYSADKTAEIAEGLGATVYFNEFKGFGSQKCFAINKATNNWVLSLDADEVISEELGAGIIKEKASPLFDGYNINILPNYCGRWIRHCGWYPQPKLRLFDKNKCGMNSNKVHESIVAKEATAKIGQLEGDILHYSYKSLSDHTKKIELYSELAARNAIEKGEKVTIFKIVLGPMWKFLYNYVLRGGFLDGYLGYVVCKNIAYTGFIKYVKIKLYTEYSNLPQEGSRKYQ